MTTDKVTPQLRECPKTSQSLSPHNNCSLVVKRLGFHLAKYQVPPWGGECVPRIPSPNLECISHRNNTKGDGYLCRSAHKTQPVLTHACVSTVLEVSGLLWADPRTFKNKLVSKLGTCLNIISKQNLLDVNYFEG